MTDCLIVGAGVVGLSLAYELAEQGARVRLIDAGLPGAEASWAGAGILPPAIPHAPEALSPLFALSNRLHARWHEQLREETDIDTGFRRSGGIYLARDPAAAAELERDVEHWRKTGVAVDDVGFAGGLAQIEPHLAPQGPIEAGCFLRDECQLRDPRHLRALLAALARRKVEITSGLPAESFVSSGRRITAVRTARGEIPTENVCIAGGAWSSRLAVQLGQSAAIVPIRGQILLLVEDRVSIKRVINEGLCYLVPRGDGRVLVGSTEEDVGFNRSTTAGAIQGLLDFALSLVPTLSAARVERSWAGLRPVSPDRRPYLGRIPGYDNAFISAGHGRHGLQLSTGTAHVMSRLILGQPVPLDLEAFRVDRVIAPA